MDEVAFEKRIYPVDRRMLSTALEPDVASQMALARGDGHETTAGLEDDPGLLCIHVSSANALDRTREGIEELPDLGVLVREVLVNRVVTAGVRHVARDEPLSTGGALPKRSLAVFGCDLAHH
jgi:hypothetical protein